MLSSCSAGQLFEDRRERAMRLAGEQGWRHERVDAGKFSLTAFHKGLEREAGELVVYIEGDGDAWRNRFTLARDPTPRNPLALKLALRDPAPAVAYLARPCQHTTDETRRGCHPAYWSSHRYAEAVIAAMNAAVDHLKDKAAAASVALVGFSGGGAVAALVAARRDDVSYLLTVAGNLDHAAWTAHHELAPLGGSLNPADAAADLRALPQVHFVGADDEIVPRQIAAGYLARLGSGAPARLISVPDADHDCCWVEAWPDLLGRYRPR
jgi:pimeloyl-ACP methyl ester carboxylesterase